MWCLSVVFAFALFASSFAEDHQQNSERSDYKRSFAKDCDNSFSMTCFKLNVVGWVDKLNDKENLSVFPGVSIVRENSSGVFNNAEVVATLAREFPNDPDARLDAFLLKKVQGFLSSHSMKLNFVEEPEDENAVTARRKKNKGGGGGGLGMLFAAAAMMKSTLFAIGMGALAALAGKALMTSLIALMLSAIIGLKSLSGGDSKTTYEVVSKPVYTHSNSHSSGHEDYHHGSGYGRSFDTMPLPLGLQPGYKPS